MKTGYYLSQAEIDAISEPNVRTAIDKEEVDVETLVVVLAKASNEGGAGGSLPTGGIAGQLLVKQSAISGDALWEPLILTGGSA